MKYHFVIRSLARAAAFETLEGRRLLSAGQLDTSFGSAGTAYADLFPTGASEAAALQADGKIVVAGTASVTGDQGAGAPFALSRFNADGSLDRTFGNGGRVTPQTLGGNFDYITGVAVQTNGDIVACGTVQDGGNGREVVVRFLPTGKLDGSFGSGGSVTVDVALSGLGGVALTPLVVQSNGKLVVGGAFFTADISDIQFGMERLTASGKLDPSFGTGGLVTTDFDGLGASLTLQKDGKIIASGGKLARYNSNGTLDTTFGQGGVESRTFEGPEVTVQPDGKLLIPNGSGIGRLMPDGALDRSFGNNGLAAEWQEQLFAENILVQKNGDVVAVGDNYSDSIKGNVVLARFTPQGKLDTTFGVNGIQRAANVDTFSGGLLQSNDSIVVPLANFAALRFTSNGVFDSTFGYYGAAINPNGISGPIRSVAVQKDGKIVVAGSEKPVSATLPTAAALARYNANGTLDTSFGTDGRVILPMGSFGEFRSIVIQPNGDIVAGGAGKNDFALARLTPAGKLDASFGAGGEVFTGFGDPDGQSAAAIALQPNGDIVAAGSLFGSHGENQWMAAARYLPNGTLDPSFAIAGRARYKHGTDISGARALLIQPNGAIVLGGSIGGDSALVRLNANGTMDKTFGLGGVVITSFATEFGSPASRTASLALDSSGNVVAGGFFYFPPSFAPGEGFVARYLPNGKLDRSFAGVGYVEPSPGGATTYVYSLAITSSGKILAGGGDNSSSVVARLTSSGVDATFGSNGLALVTPGPGETSQPADPPVLAIALQSDGKILAATGSNLARLTGT